VGQKVQIMLLCDLDDGSVDAEETLARRATSGPAHSRRCGQTLTGVGT
jgi:hypothetical protein